MCVRTCHVRVCVSVCIYVCVYVCVVYVCPCMCAPKKDRCFLFYFYFHFMGIDVLPACMYVHLVHDWALVGQKRESDPKELELHMFSYMDAGDLNSVSQACAASTLSY